MAYQWRTATTTSATGWWGAGMATTAFLAAPVALTTIAPFCEEVQFRGLAVAYFHARRWPAWAIAAAPSAAFAAIHLPYFGVGLALFILFWSAMVCAIRLWRQSLTPGLMLHVLNNIAAYLIFPLLHH